ncbi:hypothetical protein [Streptomyces vilmorinianum]|uniref:hypothetical protein n=1 Tax=Streptomyces vilmorinianum TaxID=3051092 RepID=UPI0010FB4EE7|nr:hypothetical protein [Streptomyces vilmorinianum]
MPVRSRPRPVMAAVGLAALASITLAAPATATQTKGQGLSGDLEKAYSATVKYKSEQAALDDGYLRTDECVEHETLGGMGYHYVNPANLGSTDPEKPAALLYADDKKGGRELVAVEYVVPNEGRPTPLIFGREFDGPAVIPPVGDVFTLHAWIHKKNPKGVFTPYNPKVQCCPPEEAAS